MTTRLSMALAILGCCSTRAAAEDLNIKPGLWEITIVSETKGNVLDALSAADKAEMAARKTEMENAMAKMPAEQRAKMEAAMKAVQDAMAKRPAGTSPANKSETKKECVTPANIKEMTKDMDGLFAESNQKSERSCKNSTFKSTATKIEVHQVCSEDGRTMSVSFLVTAPNPETFIFTMSSTSGGGSGVYEGTSKVNGKWLGAACGNVKPAKR